MATITSDVKARSAAPRLSEQVLLQLRESIFSGRWGPGERLPNETQLAAELAAGRSTVREAIKSLEHAGVVHIRAGRGGGTYVAEPDYRQVGKVLGTLFQMRRFDLGELFQARRFIEPGVAACAAQLATPEDLADLRFLLDQAEARLRVGEDVAGLNGHFHFAVARSTHNSLMLMLTASLLDLNREATESGIKVYEQRGRSLEQHRELTDAITARNERAAREIMERHLADMAAEVMQRAGGGANDQAE